MKQTGPAYLRLYERLRQEIIDGSWPFGARMPSKRQLSEEEGVSVVTVEHAYALLCDEGYLESRERRATLCSSGRRTAFCPRTRPGPCRFRQRRERGRISPFLSWPGPCGGY